MLRTAILCSLIAVTLQVFPNPFLKLIPDVPLTKFADMPLPKISLFNMDGIPIPDPVDVIFVNKCIEDLGCFYTGPPFYNPINRPLSLPPFDIDVELRLFTPTNPTEDYVLKAEEDSIKNSPFNANLPTKILIHGFISDLSSDDNRIRIKNKYLDEGDFNVIVVDWTSGNGFPYEQAVANTRVVGAQTAKVIRKVIEIKGIKPESVHLIGHSLGAHVCGYTGERVPNIGRITGLDPAGPYFRDSEPNVRLDTSDAIFVDIIHTDSGEFILSGVGMNNPIGHQDFYPNGGHWQPGCSHPSKAHSFMGKTVNLTQMYSLSSCDHTIGSEYFLESIGSNCQFLSVQCTSYSDFENGRCPPQNSTVAIMGEHATPIPGLYPLSKFYLRTNGSPPYCLRKSVIQ